MSVRSREEDEEVPPGARRVTDEQVSAKLLAIFTRMGAEALAAHCGAAASLWGVQSAEGGGRRE